MLGRPVSNMKQNRYLRCELVNKKVPSYVKDEGGNTGCTHVAINAMTRKCCIPKCENMEGIGKCHMA